MSGSLEGRSCDCSCHNGGDHTGNTSSSQMVMDAQQSAHQKKKGKVASDTCTPAAACLRPWSKPSVSEVCEVLSATYGGIRPFHFEQLPTPSFLPACDL